ncbi:hypothetical protein [Umezawaea sp.]|uniref:hypothetical protein n=1 Tax=Umezawaea sp. TaxID=1955258 RepID=UPI002ED19CFB
MRPTGRAGAWGPSWRHATTERRSFGHLVRSRMARTGETCSTARRHLLGEQAVRTGGGTRHGSALLRNVLGGRASGPLLAGLAGGVGFLCSVFEYAGHHPTMTIVSRHHPDPYMPAVPRGAARAWPTASTDHGEQARAAAAGRTRGGRGLTPAGPATSSAPARPAW